MARSVTVSISETYDLHTVVDKMSLIGVHTPRKELIAKTYPGLCMNYKYFRIKSVNVALSTAQQLPLGVDQIGLDANQIHPQDMMNPILYKAVSNDSWSTLEARLMGLMQQGVQPSIYTAPVLSGTMADVENDMVTGVADEHKVYYSLLANRDGFRVAHPQSGLRMSNLRPLVFTQYFNFGEHASISYGSSDAVYGVDMLENSQNAIATQSLYARSMRGRPARMPRMNTTYLTAASSSAQSGHIYNGMDNGNPQNCQTQMPDIPPVMLAAIILPPCTATTGILYYRMVTRCFIEFSVPRPIQDITSFDQMNSVYGDLVYHSDYDEQSSKMDHVTDMVDVKNAEIEKIMEGR